MTTPTLPQEPGADVRTLILSRVLPRHWPSWESPDHTGWCLSGTTREEARRVALDLLAESQRLIAEIEAYQSELARSAALVGATHEERGAAVGLKGERARRKWGYPTGPR